MTVLDLITGALQEINASAQGEPVNPGDAQFVLQKLNDLLDEWAARKVFIYTVSFPTYTLVPNLLPHTIGPMGVISRTFLNNDVATYICPNNFTNGQSCTVTGTSNGGGVLNVTGNVQAATPLQFSLAVISGNVASAADTGSVVPAGQLAPTYATPNLGPRPQRIEAASLILTTQTPAVDVPMNIRDGDWWMRNRVKALTTSVPTDLYYQPSWPDGSLYFWPVPNFAYGVRLEVWTALGNFPSVTYPFSLPPGYMKGVKLSLARDIVGPFKGSWTEQQESSWMRSMKAIESNNIKSPRGITIDAGMPGSDGGGYFNFYTGDQA